jgi:uncharacterized protein
MNQLPEDNLAEQASVTGAAESVPESSGFASPVGEQVILAEASSEMPSQAPAVAEASAEASINASIDIPAAQQPPLPPYDLQPAPKPPARIPNFSHLCFLSLFGVFGLACTLAVLFAASRFHLLGISLSPSSAMDARVILVSEGVLYLATFGVAFFVFPLFWNESYFAGIHWQGSVVQERFWRLAATSVGCFVLAMLDGVLLPGPSNAPIEQVFKTPGSAWLMFGFGVTMAPFFEEMTFRGFLLPALCTAWDWTAERFTHRPPPPIDVNGHPQWSVGAMVFGAILTSLPFAGIHVEQQGHSLGPFLLLIVVSLILCTVRLRARSLAASTVVHACYNFCIFSVTCIQTSGFRHLDKM